MNLCSILLDWKLLGRPKALLVLAYGPRHDPNEEVLTVSPLQQDEAFVDPEVSIFICLRMSRLISVANQLGIQSLDQTALPRKLRDRRYARRFDRLRGESSNGLSSPSKTYSNA